MTVWLIWSLITWVDGFVTPIIRRRTGRKAICRGQVPGTGLIIAIVALTLLGFLTANLVGRTLVGWGEGVLDRCRSAANLQDHEADFRKLVFEDRLEFPQGGTGRLRGRHVVAGVPGRSRRAATSSKSCRLASTCRLHAVHAHRRPPITLYVKRKDSIGSTFRSRKR